MVSELNPASSHAGRILVVDDSVSMRLLLCEMLKEDGYVIEQSSSGSGALLVCERSPPDFLLLDLIMPDMDGIELCRRVRSTANGRDIPVLMVTSSDDPGSVERAFEAGITDYVTKPVFMPVLRQRVRSLMRAGAAERQVRHMAFHDALTGLPNRMLLSDRMQQAVQKAKRAKQLIATMFVDLDRFKWVNDTLGHSAGDELLRTVAARLQACVRGSDTVARLGGDEFVLLLEQLSSLDGVTRVAQKILDSIQAPISIAGRDVQVGGSIGIALFPDDGADAESLMRHADAAMYRAKESGRNRYCLFQSALGAEVERQMTMTAHLREAIASDCLELRFLPQVNLRDGHIVALEALVRWRHPEHGLLNARDFMPLAEQTGLVRQLDEKVLRMVGRSIAQWRASGVDVPAVSVNFSAAHFRERNSVRHIAAVLDETGATAANLMIEVSEEVTLAQGDNVELALNAVRELGIGLCIDNFGAGPVSLANLARFPVDSVKVHPDIMRRMFDGERSNVLARGLLALTAIVGLNIVATNVETNEQANMLREMGFDEAQGFLFGPPIAAAELGDLLRRAHEYSRVAP